MHSVSVLFDSRLEAFRREVPLVADDGPEALHRARVASRRLRELIPILGLDARTARKLAKRLRKVTTSLGRVRELDVLSALVADQRRQDADSGALVMVGAAVSRARAAARARLEDKLPPAKLARLADALERAAEVEPPDADAAAARTKRWAVEARVARRASQLRSAIDDAGALYLSDRLHDVRVALKKFRYAAELLQPSHVAELKAMQDLLGQIQDREALIQWTRHVQASAVPAITTWQELADLEHALADECRAFHGRYMRRRPRLIAILERHTLSPRKRQSIA